MNKALPNKWVRKAIFDEINNIVVDGITIPVYDQYVTTDINKDDPQHYILITTQSNEVDKGNKCEYLWESRTTIDIVTRYRIPGNTGSRLLSDNILEAVKDALLNISLDALSGLDVIWQDMEFPSDLTLSTPVENVFRKILILNLKIS